MKKLIFFVCTVLFAVACNNQDAKTEGGGSDTSKMADSKMADTKMEPLDFPYKLDRPYQDWQMGDQKNAVTVLKFLRAWETKNFTECLNYIGDSIDLRLDMYHKALPHDSALAMLQGSWDNYASVTVKMYDWVSVISSDKKSEWVTLWYKQNWVDKKGKADSLNIVDDARMVNGKIVEFDEKIQHFPSVKK